MMSYSCTLLALVVFAARAFAAASPADPLYRAAVAAHKGGRAAEALRLYRRGVAADPRHINSHFGAGNALVKLGRAAEAVTHLRACAQLAPKQAEARMAHGVVLASAARWSEAAAELRETLRLPTLHAKRRPVVAQQLGAAAAALRQEGRYREAVSAFRAAWRHTDSGARRPATALAHAAALGALGRFSDALAVVRVGCNGDGGSGGGGALQRAHEFECFEAEGRMLTHLGRQQEARAAFGGALRLRPALRSTYGEGATQTLKLPAVLGALPRNSSWRALPADGSVHLGVGGVTTFNPAVRRLADGGLGVFEVRGLLLDSECATLEQLFEGSWADDAAAIATAPAGERAPSSRAPAEDRPLVICVDAAALHDGNGGKGSAPEDEFDLATLLRQAGAHPVMERGAMRLCANATEALRHSLRWSQSTLAHAGESDAVDRLEQRLEALLGLPASHARPSQLLRYSAESGSRGGYAAHTDCAADLSADDRALTALVYITTPSGGGVTTFPRLNISVAPACGTALVFNSLDMHGFCTSLSEHVAQPLMQGGRPQAASRAPAAKLVVQKWYSTRPQVRERGVDAAPFGSGVGDTTAAMTARGQPYVLCDQSRSCRSYAPFKAVASVGTTTAASEAEASAKEEL